MKLKLLLLTLCITAYCSSVFAKSTADSVGVENQNGKKVILHKLDPKDNYYSIGRRYNVSPKTIINFNNNANLTIGSIIKVPTDHPYTNAAAAKNTPSNQNRPVTSAPVSQPAISQQQPAPVTSKDDSTPTQYKVSAGETLYAIAKRFNTTVEDIIALNSLKSNSISPGQVLLIKSNTQTDQSGAPVSSAQPNQSTVAIRDSTTPPSGSDSSHHMNANKFGIYERDEKGIATWMSDDGLDPSKMLVLHKTAPIGTVIKITNVMTNRTTFAKVVGRFTDTEQTRDVIIVMTKNVAQSLGALDKRFQVNLSYGAPNEQ